MTEGSCTEAFTVEREGNAQCCQGCSRGRGLKVLRLFLGIEEFQKQNWEHESETESETLAHLFVQCLKLGDMLKVCRFGGVLFLRVRVCFWSKVFH